MRQCKTALILLWILMLVAAGVGCKKPPPAPPPSEAVPEQPPPPPPPPPVREPEPDFEGEKIVEPEPTVDELIARWNQQGVLNTVYFAFDSSELSEAARRTLQQNAEWLKGHGDVNAVIEGHCDERGTIEYNLALGERRASSVRDYLASLGLARGRLRLVTYGEERPVDRGHTEAAWSQNRRAAFVLER